MLKSTKAGVQVDNQSGDISDIRKRLQSANFGVLNCDDKEHVAATCKISKRPRMDSGDTLTLQRNSN